MKSLEERIELDKKSKHDIELVIDRLVLKPDVRSRLTDSVETALREGKGMLIVTDETGDPASDRVMSELNACHALRPVLRRADARVVLLQQPAGHVHGLQRPGHPAGDGPGPASSRTPRAAIRDGAVEPWASGMNTRRGLDGGLRGAAWPRPSSIDLDTPYGKLPASARRTRDVRLRAASAFTVKWGDGGRYEMEWEGLVNKLMRSFKTTTVRGDAHATT